MKGPTAPKHAPAGAKILEKTRGVTARTNKRLLYWKSTAKWGYFQRTARSCRSRKWTSALMKSQQHYHSTCHLCERSSLNRHIHIVGKVPQPSFFFCSTRFLPNRHQFCTFWHSPPGKALLGINLENAEGWRNAGTSHNATLNYVKWGDSV